MVLIYGPLVFPLQPGPGGPVLQSSACGPWEPAARLANAIVCSQPTGRDALAHAQPVKAEGVMGWAPDRAELGELLAVGDVSPDDAYAVAVIFLSPGSVYPRSALLALVDALIARRAAPPDAGPPPDPLAELEALAHQVIAEARTADALRPRLLAGLAEAGLLAVQDPLPLIQDLERRGLPILGSYVRSATALRQYGRSVERAAHLPVPASDELSEIAVSLEWFRLGVLPPGGYHPHHWLAFCERALLDAPALAPASAGELYTGGGGLLAVVNWRRDDGVRPVVIGAQLARLGP